MRIEQKGHIESIILVILVAAAVVGAFFYVIDHRKSAAPVNIPASGTGTSSSGADNVALPSGSDDQSLNSDLSNINSGLTQGSQNLQTTDTGLNDQQLPVTQ